MKNYSLAINIFWKLKFWNRSLLVPVIREQKHRWLKMQLDIQVMKNLCLTTWITTISVPNLSQQFDSNLSQIAIRSIDARIEHHCTSRNFSKHLEFRCQRIQCCKNNKFYQISAFCTMLLFLTQKPEKRAVCCSTFAFPVILTIHGRAKTNSQQKLALVTGMGTAGSNELF